MTLGTPPTRFTPEDLLRLEEQEARLSELVDGKLVEKDMGALANRTAGLIATRLNNYCESKVPGAVIVPEQSFQCFPHDRELVRRPDVALILASRAHLIPDEGTVPVPPDLAVEVISPNDKIYAFEEKLEDYRKAAIPLVWEVNPRFRFIRIHHLDREPRRIEETDTITGEPVLPGFSIRVCELLPPAISR